MKRTLAKEAGLTERDRKTLQESLSKAQAAMRIAKASTSCGMECQEAIEGLAIVIDQATTMLRMFWNEDPIEEDADRGETD